MTRCSQNPGGKCPHRHHHHHELVVRGVSVSYHKTPALTDISFATSCGKSLALVGPNGAGKSTLLKAIAGLLHRTGGSILWRDAPVNGSQLGLPRHSARHGRDGPLPPPWAVEKILRPR